jgi:acyl-coenzyme A thioesterase PaaI-like protein
MLQGKVTSEAADYHPRCFVCGPAVSHGLHLHGQLQPDGSFLCAQEFGAAFEGYSGLVHGGILAAALDGAMTQLLLLKGYPALTAELKIRYRSAVGLGERVIIRATLEENADPLFLMKAQMIGANGKVSVAATAKFIHNHATHRLLEKTR